MTIPVIGIGGITLENVGQLQGAVATGLAVMGAVMEASNPALACGGLLEVARTLVAPEPGSD